jgi:hypothetical protein
MARSRALDLTIAQQLARLRIHDVDSRKLAKALLEMRGEQATVSGHGGRWVMRGLPAKALAWELAMAAQSSAYLATELQVLAEKLADSPTTYEDSTYRQLFASVETLRRLLDIMAERFKGQIRGELDPSALVLPERLVGAIRSASDLAPATTTAGSTTNTESLDRQPISDAGDTK